MSRLEQHSCYFYKGGFSATEEAYKDICKLTNLSKDALSCHEDILIYDSSDLKAEDLESVLREFHFRPSELKHKILVFLKADILDRNLQNKLLKPLEDAHEEIKVVFIGEKNLLPTVESRCSKFVFTEKNLCSFPKTEDEFLELFTKLDAEKQLRGLYRAIVNRKSILVGSGLYAEKTIGMPIMVENFELIIHLIIAHDLETMDISRSQIVKRFLGKKATENLLYVMFFELHMMTLEMEL